MKTVSSGAQTKIDTIKATEPVLIIKIGWYDGDVYYGEKSITGVDYANVLSISGFNESFSVGQINNIGVLSVVLDDSSGDLKTVFDTENILGLVAECYLAYTEIATDGIKLVTGKVGGPIIWDEGQRTLSFAIISDWGYRTAGFSLQDNDTADGYPIVALESAIGQAWPMCWGSALRVPALKIIEPFRGETESDFPLDDSEVEVKVNYTGSVPTGSQTYSIKNIKCTGEIEGDILTIAAGTMNGTWYTGVTIESRTLHHADEDYSNHTVLWISDSSKNLLNLYCYTGTKFQKCIRQDGKKCWFTSDWYSSTGTQPTSFTEVRGFPDDAWTGYVTNMATYTVILSGSVIYWVDDPNIETVYIANLFESTGIAEVMAYRSYGMNDIQKLVAVPSSRFTIDYDYPVPDRYKTNNPDANTVCTAIKFETPLHRYVDEKWKDDVIYVSLWSTLSYNTATLIETFVTYFSDLSSDVSSRTLIGVLVTKYPMHGFLVDELNVLDLIQDLAWQARMGIFIRHNTVYYKLLSREPISGSGTLAESKALHKSISVSLTDDVDLITKAKATWKLEGSQTKAYELTLENNVDLFGNKKQDFNFYAYNIKSVVQKSLQFWLNRKSNVWKILSVSTPLPLVGLDVGDYVNLNFTNNPIASSSVYGLLIDIVYDMDKNLLTYNIWTPVIAGTLTQSSDAYVTSVGDPTPDNPIEGRTLVDYTPEIYVEPDNAININNAETKPDISWSYVYFCVIKSISGTTCQVNFYNEDDIEQTAGEWSNVTVNLQSTYGGIYTYQIPKLSVNNRIIVAKHSGEWYYVGGILTTVYRG
jgi:hypothetical protein